MLLAHKKLIFIHIPKCAGTSIEVCLTGKDWAKVHPESKHLTCQFAVEYYGRDVWDECFKFSIVRNPWARMVSFYNLIRTAEPDVAFDDWIRQVCSPEGLLFQGLPIHRSQMDYLADANGEVMVDFVGKVESLADDFAIICEKAGIDRVRDLPRAMIGRYDHDYRSWYVPATRDLLAERYRDDIERFGYDY